MGTVSAELTETPGSVQCILFRLTRASFVRQVTLNVSAGQSTASVSLGTLAAGSYTLTADAYSQACSTSPITWTAPTVY